MRADKTFPADFFTDQDSGDLFLLSTDGVHEYVSTQELLKLLRGSHNPEQVVREIVERAHLSGSSDNLTCQIVRIDRLPIQDKHELYEQLTELPFPPSLEAGMVLDGYRILRELHASKRSQIYLALDVENGEELVLKTPSVNYEDEPEYIDRFLQEEWVGKRMNSPYIIKIRNPKKHRTCLYYITEFAEGQTLRQWILDHPCPPLAQVRGIVDQIASGLRTFHRMDMVHQDLKPENIMIDAHGSVKIIDFGSSKIAGVEEISVPWERNHFLGTLNYTAPECLQGNPGTNVSDLFSLGVITYEMLTGKLPYGESLSPRSFSRASYSQSNRYNPEIPLWVEGALKKAVQKDPRLRYDALSAFTYDLSHPNPMFLSRKSLPLLEKNPLAFWRAMAILFLMMNLILLYLLSL